MSEGAGGPPPGPLVVRVCGGCRRLTARRCVALQRVYHPDYNNELTQFLPRTIVLKKPPGAQVRPSPPPPPPHRPRPTGSLTATTFPSAWRFPCLSHGRPSQRLCLAKIG